MPQASSLGAHPGDGSSAVGQRLADPLVARPTARCRAAGPTAETRYSSSIQRTARSDALGGRPGGSAVDLVQPGVLEVGDLVHQLAVAARPARRASPAAARPPPGSAGSCRSCAAPASPTKPRCTSRPTWACMSVSAGSVVQVGAAAERLRRCAATRRAPSSRRPCAARSRPLEVVAGARRAGPSYAASSRTDRPGVDDVADARRRGSPRAAPRPCGYGDPASAELLGVGEPVERAGDRAPGEGEQQQAAYAEPVPRLGLLRRAEDAAGRRSRPRRPAPGSRAPRGRRGAG